MKIELSKLDSQRFGFPCARSSGWHTHADTQVIDFCNEHKIRLLILRTNVSNTDATWQIQKSGAILVDTLLYFTKLLEPGSIPVSEPEYSVRACKKTDKDKLFQLGASSFSNYFGHYHNDAMIAENICDEIYGDWSASFASCEPNKPCYLVEYSNAIAGIAGLSIKEEGSHWDGELFAVTPDARGVGLFSTLLDHSLKQAFNAGAKKFSYSTQIQNTTLMNSLLRRGFELEKSVNTFHKWCDV